MQHTVPRIQYQFSVHFHFPLSYQFRCIAATAFAAVCYIFIEGHFQPWPFFLVYFLVIIVIIIIVITLFLASVRIAVVVKVFFLTKAFCWSSYFICAPVLSFKRFAVLAVVCFAVTYFFTKGWLVILSLAERPCVTGLLCSITTWLTFSQSVIKWFPVEKALGALAEFIRVFYFFTWLTVIIFSWACILAEWLVKSPLWALTITITFCKRFFEATCAFLTWRTFVAIK